MNKWQALLFIFLLIGISSCDKESDDELTRFPVSYAGYLISESEIKVYTKDGEVTNSDSKEKTIQDYKYMLTDLETFKVQEKIVATYLTKDTLELTLNNGKEEKTRLVYEDNELLYWEKQDTSLMYISDITDLSKFYKLKPLYYKEFDLPASTGYNKKVRYKECFYASRENGKLKIPMLDFLQIHPSYTARRTEINNEFDESYLSSIGINDTIMIQEYIIEMN